VYYYRSCLWRASERAACVCVCVAGGLCPTVRTLGYYIQRAQGLRLSERFFSFKTVVGYVCKFHIIEHDVKMDVFKAPTGCQ